MADHDLIQVIVAHVCNSRELPELEARLKQAASDMRLYKTETQIRELTDAYAKTSFSSVPSDVGRDYLELQRRYLIEKFSLTSTDSLQGDWALIGLAFVERDKTLPFRPLGQTPTEAIEAVKSDHPKLAHSLNIKRAQMVTNLQLAFETVKTMGKLRDFRNTDVAIIELIQKSAQSPDHEHHAVFEAIRKELQIPVKAVCMDTIRSSVSKGRKFLDLRKKCKEELG